MDMAHEGKEEGEESEGKEMEGEEEELKEEEEKKIKLSRNEDNYKNVQKFYCGTGSVLASIVVVLCAISLWYILTSKLGV